MSAVALALVFGFQPGVSHTFNATVDFDGFLPILGGRDGKANVILKVVANGVKAENGGLAAVESHISEIEVTAFGSKLPLNGTNVDQFFPKAVATFTPFGEIKSNTAPAIKMPARLPGLDSRRLPEISYLPIQLPTQKLKAGETYTFEKVFGEFPVKYVVTYLPDKGDKSLFSFKLNQDEKGFEDAYGNPVEEEKFAKARFATKLSGDGTAQFDQKTGTFDIVVIKATSETTVTVIKGGAIKKRALTTTMKIIRDGFKL